MKILDKEKLIKLVHHKRAIWDKSHPHHFNKGILHKHWQAISAELQIPEHVIKRQWKYLRQEFGRQLKRAATAAVIAPEEDDITSWPHYYSMLFVVDQFTSRGSEDTLDGSSQPMEMLTPKVEVESGEDSDSDLKLPTTPRTVHESHIDVESDHSRASSAVSEPVTSIQLGKPILQQPMITHSVATTSSAPQAALTPIPHPQKPAHSDCLTMKDDDVAFFDSILPHVKSLRMESKFQFRMQVQKLLYNMMFPAPNAQLNAEDSPERPAAAPEKPPSTEQGYLARIVPISKC